MINAKLVKFNISYDNFNDYFQELRMTVLDAIRKYDDNYGKSLCRFLELIIERKVLRLLYRDLHKKRFVSLMEDTVIYKDNCEVLDEMIYESRLNEIKKMKLDSIKSNILEQVFVKGVSVKDYAEKYGMSVKDVYNHIYLLRCKVKDRFNL